MMSSSYMHPLKLTGDLCQPGERILPKPSDQYLFICTQIDVKARKQEALNFLL